MIPIRVLVCDDDILAEVVQQRIKKPLGERVHCDLVRTPAEGRAAIDASDYDLAFIDFRFPNDTGLGLLSYIAERAPSCRRVLMTKHLEKTYRDVFEYAARPAQKSPLSLANKSDFKQNFFLAHINAHFERRLEQRWVMPDVSVVAGQLARLSPQKAPGLRRESSASIEREVQKILFELFDMSASAPLEDEATTQLDIDPEIMHGRTGSVALRARLDYGGLEGGPVYGSRCVVKIGPRESIKGESEKFQELVRMGVPSEFRVELIGTAVADGLAGVCYSAAGGSFSGDVVSLDVVLQRGDMERAHEVVERLFDTSEKSWDNIRGGDQTIAGFYHDAFNADFVDRIRRVRSWAKASGFGTFDEETSRWTLGQHTVDLPVDDAPGHDLWPLETPTCLIHGDLHGGNVLVTATGKPYMIDFATVRIGPRFADAAALAATVRLQVPELATDAVALDEKALSTYLDGDLRLTSSKLEDPDTLQYAMERFADHPWFGLARRLDALARTNADAEDARLELMQTQLAYALYICQPHLWNSAQQLRLAAWIGALQTRLKGKS